MMHIMTCARYRNVSDMRRGTSLRYPLKEKKRITHNLSAHSSSTRTSNQFNGVDHKKALLSETLSTVTIKSDKVVNDNDTEYTPITNGSLRRQVLISAGSSEDVPTTRVVRAGSLEDVSRSDGGHRPSVASRSLSVPLKDQKSVKLKDKDSEFARLRDTPALQFLTRKDLYKYMSRAGVSLLCNCNCISNYL